MPSKDPVEPRAVVRRSKRVPLSVPVLISGHARNNKKFDESTATLMVNANGGLVLLATRVDVGETVVVRNRLTQEEEQCRIVYVGPQQAQGKARVGVAFQRPAKHFWKIDFPPLGTEGGA
ncbi:MAG TPA: hypothetical protein VF982_01090 [Anaerolineales bacterium]